MFWYFFNKGEDSKIILFFNRKKHVAVFCSDYDKFCRSNRKNIFVTGGTTVRKCGETYPPLDNRPSKRAGLLGVRQPSLAVRLSFGFAFGFFCTPSKELHWITESYGDKRARATKLLGICRLRPRRSVLALTSPASPF